MFSTIIVDNFFEDIKKIIKISKQLKYYPPTKTDNWGGLRTKSLHLTHYDLFNDIIKKILSYYYSNNKIKFSDSSMFFSKLNLGDIGKTLYHYDEGTKIAAVIYLSSGNMKTGTTLFNKNEEKQIIIGNDLNTMVCYDGNKYHGPSSTLNLKKERLTLNVFIKNIEII
tara:strand:+ start:68 stop:571 length:504 start_codon:yes stop_codon:yes gene_type:complete